MPASELKTDTASPSRWTKRAAKEIRNYAIGVAVLATKLHSAPLRMAGTVPPSHIGGRKVWALVKKANAKFLEEMQIQE